MRVRVPPRVLRRRPAGARSSTGVTSAACPICIPARHVSRRRALAPRGRSIELRIYCDSAYPGVIEEVGEAIRSIHPRQRAWARDRPHAQCRVVVSGWRQWPVLFPQHGPGRKHERPIVLAPWQLAITSDEPRALLRGLLHSDGCRFVAHQPSHGRFYSYVRYHFSNRSEDIKRIFCDHLDLLGIGWTRPTDNAIAIARRSEVAKLEEFVGPKR